MKVQKDYLNIELLNSNLKVRTISSGKFTVTAQLIKFMLTMISNIVLARLLMPEDYGLIAMVTVVTNFAALFKDLGFTSAIIQKEKIETEQVSKLFWINLAVTLFLTILIICISPLISMFYGEPKLTGIAMALSVTFIFGGLSSIHQALLRRQMEFKIIAFIEVISMIIGTFVGILFAFINFSYWSLVIMQLTIHLISFCLTVYFCEWKPSLPKKGVNVSKLVKFGANLTGFNIVNYFSRQGDDLLIGRFLGSVQLGFYTRAYRLFLMPISQISGPINSVALPALSRLVSSPVKYRKTYLTLVKAILIVSTPFIVFMIIASEQVILLLLGEQWVYASTVFAYLAIVGFLQPISNTTGLLFITQDRTSEQLKWGLVSSVLTIASFLIGLPYGIEGVAASYAISGLLIRTPLLLAWVGRKGPIKQIDFYKVLYPYMISGIFSLLCLYYIEDKLAAELLVLNLLILFSTTIIIFYACLSLFRGGREFMMILFSLLANQVNNIFTKKN